MLSDVEARRQADILDQQRLVQKLMADMRFFQRCRAFAKAPSLINPLRSSDAVRDAEAAVSACVADLLALPADTQAEFVPELGASHHRFEILQAVTACEQDPPALGATTRSFVIVSSEVESGRNRSPCDDRFNLMTLTKASVDAGTGGIGSAGGRGSQQPRYLRGRQLFVQVTSVIVATVLNIQHCLTGHLQRQAAFEMTRGPWAKLATSAAKAAKDIRAAQSARERVLTQKRGCSLQPGAGTAQETAAKNGLGRPLRPIFEYGSSCLQEVPTFATQASMNTVADGGGAPKLDASLPFLQTDQGSAAAKHSGLYAMKDAAAAFAAVWGTSPPRASPGCAMLKLTVAASDIAAAGLAENLAGSALHVDLHEALRASLAPGTFAVAAGSEAVFTERDGMPSLRVASAATRLVVMMQVAAARRNMSIGAAGADAPPVKGSMVKLSHSVLNLTREDVADAARRFPVYFSTLGPGELLYTPANWITCESAHSSKPVRDVRSPGLWLSGIAAGRVRPQTNIKYSSLL